MSNGNESAPVIEVTGLGRKYGRKEALQDVSLRVGSGGVFGLVGENGAGKTTLIQHLLGALRPQSGTVRVFGADPAYDPPAVLSRIGYLSEDRDLPGWMRVGEFLRYMRAFYPGWDAAFAERMVGEFGLNPAAKIRSLSRGEQARTGLLAAVAHRPELLLLDEPSSGLDAVARQQILAAVVRTVAEEGRTVVFSSHLLDEVERVADHVLMLHQGRVVMDMPMDEVKARHRTHLLRWAEVPAADAPALPGMLRAERDGREWRVLCDGDAEALAAAVRAAGGEILETAPATLEAVFVARVGA